MKFSKAITSFLSVENLSQKDFSDATGFHTTQISSWVNGRNEPYQVTINKILKVFPKFEEYLNVEKTENLNTFKEPGREYHNGYSKKKQLRKHTDGGVPFYGSDITSSIVTSFNDLKEIPQYYIDVSPLNDCDAWFTNRGDSMYPKYRNGQQLAVKTINNYEAILWGESYLIITNTEANNLRTVKNIFQHEDSGRIILRAVNPDYKGDTVLYKKNILSIHMVKGDLNISHN